MGDGLAAAPRRRAGVTPLHNTLRHLLLQPLPLRDPPPSEDDEGSWQARHGSQYARYFRRDFPGTSDVKVTICPDKDGRSRRAVGGGTVRHFIADIFCSKVPEECSVYSCPDDGGKTHLFFVFDGKALGRAAVSQDSRNWRSLHGRIYQEGDDDGGTASWVSELRAYRYSLCNFHVVSWVLSSDELRVFIQVRAKGCHHD